MRCGALAKKWIPPPIRDMTYYERWIASIEAILIEKKILSKEEIDRKLADFEAKWGEP
jgi:Nitrile hydratase beta subunit